MSKAKAKFAHGDNVNHPAAPDGSFPAGTGVVESVDKSADGYSYRVKCSTTQTVLPCAFKESELTLCDD